MTATATRLPSRLLRPAPQPPLGLQQPHPARQLLYGTDDQLGTDDIDVTALRPRMARTESTGDCYTLHHTMIHSVTAQPHTTSLIVRGPAVKDRFNACLRTLAQIGVLK